MEGTLKPASIREAVKTVLSGFIGIRRKADHESAPLKPLHIVIAAVVFTALFIFTLVTVVRIVTG